MGRLDLLPDWTYLPSKEDWVLLEGRLKQLEKVLRVRGVEQVEASGVETQDGQVATTTYSWAHGLPSAPTSVSVVPGSQDAEGTGGDWYVTVDATNINVIYQTAPPTGTDNLTWYWMVT